MRSKLNSRLLAATPVLRRLKRLVCAALLLWSACAPAVQAASADVFWVWHAGNPPEDAQHLAVLLDHFEFNGDSVNMRPRRRALRAPPGVQVTPVVHAQMAARSAGLGAQQRSRLLKSVVDAASESTSGWVQLDFEVTKPHRELLLELVAELKRRLPPKIRLSVTMQAHWCREPALVQRIEADEIVPMFFHTGDSLANWWDSLRAARGGRASNISPACLRGAAGFSTQEPPPRSLRNQFEKRYWFATRSPGVSTREKTQ